MPTRHIAFYGKGGGLASTVAANVGAALAEDSHRVIVVGCDPQNACTSVLHDKEEIVTVLEALRLKDRVALEDIAANGFNDVLCIEAMSSYRSDVCAGRGIGEVFSFFRKTRLLDEYRPDVVIYDLPAEVVCGAFIFPAENNFFDGAYVVSSADFISLSAANNIFRTIRRNAERGGTKLGGIIAHGLTSAFAESIVKDFAERTGTRVISHLPHSTAIIQSELYGQTVLQAGPSSSHAFIYRRLAGKILDNGQMSIPNPFSGLELRRWAREWGDWLWEIEQGIIRNGESI
ncbi:MAG TPA: AAA family ATPase [Geobacteraceae bacterium]|nr:AAA family ATPase [Geobacteraceae bacterium]